MMKTAYSVENLGFSQSNSATKLIVAVFVVMFYMLFAPDYLLSSFEDNSGGARMRSLGSAFTAVADDSESVFAQPAGTVRLRSPEVSFTYGRLFLGLYDESDIGNGALSAAIPLSKNIGLGLGIKSTELKRVYAEQTMIMNVSYRIRDYMSAGINMKYLGVKYGSDAYTAIDPVFASGYDRKAAEADAGVLISPLGFLTIGINKKNILGSNLGLQEKSPAAVQDYYGVCYREANFTLAGEVQKINSNMRYVAGMEKSFMNDLFRGRFGLGWGDGNYRNFSTGFGLNFNEFILDYAWEYPLSGIEQISGTHYLSFSTKFGRKPAPVVKAEPVIEVPPMAPLAGVPAIAAPVAAVAPVPLPGMLLPSFLPPLVSPSTEQEQAVSAPAVEKPKPPQGGLEPAELEVKKVPVIVPHAEVQPGLRTYKAIEGDTLMSLSEKYYGNRAGWVKIYQTNKDKIEKGAVKPGQILIIP